MRVDGGGGGFDVSPGTLYDASFSIQAVQGEVAYWTGDFGRQAASVQSTLSELVAGNAWSDVVSSWAAALKRLPNALAAYGANTVAAAVAYENVDQMAMPRLPMIQPPPSRQPSNGGDNSCQPDMFGQLPARCRMA